MRLSGTLGVVLAAKEEGLISHAAPLLEALVQAGLRASDALLAEVLHQAGEQPL